MRYVRKRLHEDNRKAQIDRLLRPLGIHFVLEYTHKNCRFDGVVVREGEILAIVEIKSWSESQFKKAKRFTPKQFAKYLKFDIPVLVIWDFKGIYAAVKKIRKIVKRYDDTKRLFKKTLLYYPEHIKRDKRKELYDLVTAQARDMKYENKVW